MVAAPAATTAATDQESVNRARVGLRRWCLQMLDDVAPAHQAHVDRQPRLVDLALQPVGVLRVLLDADPQPVTLRAPLHISRGVVTANEQWRQLGAAVEVATYGWVSSDPVSRPTGERAWATVADVAAVAEAAAALDRELMDRQPDKHGMRQVRECREIAIAAEHVRRFATSGPLPRPDPLRPAPHRLRPQPVRTLADLPAALANLATLVTTAGHLRPETIGSFASAHARTLDTLATALAATSPPAHRVGRRRFAATLRAHGETLSNIRVACRTLRSIDADDPRPAMQMREIRIGLRALATYPARAGEPQAQKALLAALRPALGFAPAVLSAAGSHVRSGRWLMPAAGTRLGWAAVSHHHPITDAVELAAAHARGLTYQLPPPRLTGSPYRAAPEVLASELLRPDRRRPLSPAGPAPVI
ncbi:MAG: hypothetical protein ACRDT6_07175 [Micromonosporaceae bacterium]